MSATKVGDKLEDNKLWQTASRIAEKAYGLLSEFPEEEKWGMQSKVRQRAFEVSSEVADALGSIDPREINWHLGLGRRSLFGLKNSLILGSKVGYLDTDPDLLRDIEQLTEEVDAAISVATTNIPNWYEEMQAPEKSQ